MELRYLPHYNRITLWRNTIQLFHTTHNYSGPFKKAGYEDYIVEHHLNKCITGEDLSPDIVAFSQDGWLIVDITSNDKSKGQKLDSYKLADSRTLSQFGKQKYQKAPDTICCRFIPINDGDHCQLFVKDILDVHNEQFINDPRLKDELLKSKGDDLSKVPEIPISLVPEMSLTEEIRGGLIDIVMQLFAPDSNGLTSYQMCEIALERLFDKVPYQARNALTNKIEEHMKVLVAEDLKGYLESRDGKYCATTKFTEHPKTLESISMRLKRWAYPNSRTLLDYT